MTNRDESRNGPTLLVDKEGVIRYLNIRPGNTEKDLLSTEELLSEVKKVNSGK